MEFHFWSGLSPRSLTTSGINGTMPNHAKKQRKKAMDVIQKVLVERLLRLSKSNLVAFDEFISSSLFYGTNLINIKYKYVEYKYKYVEMWMSKKSSSQIVYMKKRDLYYFQIHNFYGCDSILI